MSEVVEEKSSLQRAGLLSVCGSRSALGRHDQASNLLKVQKESPVTQPASLRFGCLVAVRGTVRHWRRSTAIWPHLRIFHFKRRGSEFELGDALNEPWDAGFPQFNSTPDKSDSGFCYFGVRYGSTVKDQCKIFFFVLRAHVF